MLGGRGWGWGGGGAHLPSLIFPPKPWQSPWETAPSSLCEQPARRSQPSLEASGNRGSSEGASAAPESLGV